MAILLKSKQPYYKDNGELDWNCNLIVVYSPHTCEKLDFYINNPNYEVIDSETGQKILTTPQSILDDEKSIH